MFDLLDEPRLTTLSDKSALFSPAKMKIISAAEKMLGEQSLSGAPLYKISEAAGLQNRYAVQYHFETRDGLVDAVFSARAEILSARRLSLIDLMETKGLQDDLPSLLQSVYLPMAEQVDDSGHHSYIRFVLQYFIRPDANASLDSRSSPSGGPAERIYRQISAVTGLSFSEVSARIYYLGFSVHAAILSEAGGGAATSNSIARTLQSFMPFMMSWMTTQGTTLSPSNYGFVGGEKARA